MSDVNRSTTPIPGERLHRFHGGLRLRHNKAVSCRDPLERLPLPERLVVPLRQHRGPAAEPLAQPGQVVSKGEIIGEAPAGGAHIHAFDRLANDGSAAGHHRR